MQKSSVEVYVSRMNGTGICIRQAKVEDAERIAALSQELGYPSITNRWDRGFDPLSRRPTTPCL